jgi:GT2 family glycosyltransferase
MNDEVDVIILSWNRSVETIAAIESALSQQGISVTVLVVDQGSTETNLKILRNFATQHSNIRLKELGINVGVARGRNIATSMGVAPYVVTLDNDAVFSDSYVLQSVAGILKRQLTLGAIAFRIVNYMTGKDDKMCWDYPRVPSSHADREFLVTRFIGAGNAIRRQAFIGAGEYDELLFFGGEERDLSYRIINLGYQIKYSPDLVVLHKVDPEARVRWQDGRYYYIVRNGLYSDFKFGTPMWKLARTAAAIFVKGVYNGMGTQAIRAIFDASVMAIRFTKSDSLKTVYKLRNGAKQYIEACENTVSESFWHRVQQQFHKLPEQV